MAEGKPITARARREAAQAIVRADMRARATLRPVTVEDRADEIVRGSRCSGSVLIDRMAVAG